MDKEFSIQTDSSPHSYDSFDNYLIEKSTYHAFPQTEFQCNHFVSGSHATLYRQVRQSLLEISTRQHGIEKINISVKRTKIQIEKCKKKIEETDDVFEKQLAEIEIEDLSIDLCVWKKKLEQAHIELKYFLDFVKNVCADETEAERYFELNEEEEHKYWIARLAKQLSIDIITSGRLGSGNLDSILQLPESDQIKTMQLALNYSGAINAGVDNLKLNAEKTIRFLKDELPNKNYLEENSDVTSESKSLQSTDKSQTNA